MESLALQQKYTIFNEQNDFTLNWYPNLKYQDKEMFLTSMYLLHRFNFFLFGYKHASYLNRNEGNDLLSVNGGFLDFAECGNDLFPFFRY